VNENVHFFSIIGCASEHVKRTRSNATEGTTGNAQDELFKTYSPSPARLVDRKACRQAGWDAVRKPDHAGGSNANLASRLFEYAAGLDVGKIGATLVAAAFERTSEVGKC
jgi:hypothetical protein